MTTRTPETIRTVDDANIGTVSGGQHLLMMLEPFQSLRAQPGQGQASKQASAGCRVIPRVRQVCEAVQLGEGRGFVLAPRKLVLGDFCLWAGTCPDPILAERPPQSSRDDAKWSRPDRSPVSEPAGPR